MQASTEFNCNYIEVSCSDMKIIFITDKAAIETGDTVVHMHSFWELFYLQKGHLCINSENQKLNLYPNQALIIPPGVYHNSSSDSTTIKKSVLFTLEKIKSPSAESLFAKIYSAFCNCDFFKLDNCEYIGQLLNMILNNPCSDEVVKNWLIKSHVTELLLTLYENIKTENLINFDNFCSPNNYCVYKYAIDKLLDMYYMTDISLEELSRKIYTSPQTVSRIIFSSYGKSFSELKLELKIRNAKKMLCETTLNINDIGQMNGYTTSRGFFAAFMKYEGCTPSEYRERHKKSRNHSTNNLLYQQNIPGNNVLSSSE